MDLCTIITANYLPAARVMLRSYREYMPDGRLFVLLLDKTPAGLAPALPECDILSPEDLGIASLEELRMQYTAYELSMALRPRLFLHLLNKRDAQKVLFLDSDILITGPFDRLGAALEKHDIVLTPSFLSPLPDDGKHPSERDILAAGTYNAGCLAFRRSQHAISILEWLADRLSRYSFCRPQDNLFGDQKWIDLVPALLESTGILRDPSYNVAVWNLHERTITKEGDRYLINGEPMTFFHFSGFRPGAPPVLSVHQNRLSLDAGTALMDLATRYSDLLIRAGYDALHSLPYAFDRFENGVSISPIVRRIFSEAGGAQRFSRAFTTGSGSFYSWLSSAVHGSPESGILRIHTELHRLSVEASARFESPAGRDAPSFARWLLGTSQLRRFGLDEEFLSSLRPLALEAPAPHGSERLRSLIRNRHHCGPYQILCRFIRRVLGDRRYDSLKPRRSALEKDAESLQPSSF